MDVLLPLLVATVLENDRLANDLVIQGGGLEAEVGGRLRCIPGAPRDDEAVRSFYGGSNIIKMLLYTIVLIVFFPV